MPSSFPSHPDPLPYGEREGSYQKFILQPSSYLDKEIVPAAKRDDALHIGIATVFEMDAVITWNYRHLANLRRVELFHSANLEAGYFKRIEIITPMEVIRDEG